MKITRLLSYAAVAILGASLWTNWVKEHPQTEATATPAVTHEKPNEQGVFVPQTFSPTVAKTDQQSHVASSVQEATLGRRITVKTDNLMLAIDLDSGDIMQAQLPEYPVSTRNKTPITLFSAKANQLYYAQSGFTNINKVSYQAAQRHYELKPDADSLSVTLEGKTDQGLLLTKTFTIKRGDYTVSVDYRIRNNGQTAWQGSLFTQFLRKKPEKQGHMLYARSYNGGAISSPEIPYQKITYKEMDKANVDQTAVGGWAAMQQHYFLSAWIPGNQQQTNYFYSRVNDDRYTLGFVSPKMTVSPKQEASAHATLYVGPEIASDLKALAPGLERTIDYGWLFWISIAIFWLMEMIHWLVGNWGWSIVITTIIIKFILYPLSATSFRSMARMRELQPKMQQLKERHADDRQAMSRATMELYKKEKINPLGGCLPMLIQIPIFIALYYVIIESVQLRQAPFIFWIHDLAVKDPYYVLPILMGVSMLAQQKLTPSSPDPAQAKMMMFIPVVFTIFFVNFPAGLTLYWLVNNCVQILQQLYVSKTFEAHQAKKARKAKAKKKAKAYFIKK